MRKLKVNVIRFNEKAVLPKKKYDDDFCYDVTATSVEKLGENIYKYQLDIGFQIDDESLKSFGLNMHNVCIDFRPRSSVWETGLILSNCEGTIDKGYTKGVSAVFYHVITDLKPYEVGDRIGQIKLGVTLPLDFVEVEKFSTTKRGNNGYGSTGRK